MAPKITGFQRFMMRNPFVQFFTFIYLNVKILLVVGEGHHGTRGND